MNMSLSVSLNKICFAVYFAIFIGLSGCVTGDAAESVSPAQGLLASKDAVASAHPLASKAGMDVLADGGNAYDAAVTVAAVLAVVEPFGSGLGGGGFWLLHDAKSNKSVFVDGRETAPLAAFEEMYQDGSGVVDRELATNHPMAAGIPGTPAAMVHIQKKYGLLSLERLLAPAIQYAKHGFEVTSEYQGALRMRLSALQKWPSSSVFLQNGALPAVGWRLAQPGLAATLERLAKNGKNGFYQGETAEIMVNAVKSAGGIWSAEDLMNYEVVEREPIRFQFEGASVTTSPLPSSGGLVLGLLFGQMQEFDLTALSSESRLHLFIESMRNAYYQRALSMGDSDFTHDDGRQLLSNGAIQAYAQQIDLERAAVSADFPAVTDGTKGDQTTHFSILDRHGNRAAVTLSINLYFGSGFTAGTTGVLLNNEMDDFSAKPGEPNAYGLVGSKANKIEPGKRPLSSMSPTFVETADNLYILGTPGGSRIISMVAGALNYVLTPTSEAPDVDKIVSLGRVHHQYLPDKVFFEPGALSIDAQKVLQDKGHELQELSRQYGDMQLIHMNKTTGLVQAASDPRGEGAALVKNQ